MMTATTSQPISIARDQRSSSSSSNNMGNNHNLNSSTAAHLLPPAFFPAPGSPMHISSSSSQHLNGQPPHNYANYNSLLANPRYAGTSPRSAESSTSWSIHPGPLFVSAGSLGSLGSTSGSLGESAAGSFRGRGMMHHPNSNGNGGGVGCSPAQVLNPLEPEFKFRGIVGSMESDHGSLINPHMSEREVEQFRNFTCCGLTMNDLHALVEHFEVHHICLVDPLQQQIQQIQQLQNYNNNNNNQHPLCSLIPNNNLNSNCNGQQHPNPNGAQLPYQQPRSTPTSPSSSSSSAVPNTNTNSGQGTGSGSGSPGRVPTRTDSSSLAGALGPGPSSSSSSTAAAAGGFDLDDMELDMEMEMEPEPLEPEHVASTSSPAPSASSSRSNPNSSSSNRSSPMGGSAGPLPLTQPQRFAHANANGVVSGGGTMSSLSSPPDTPLLMTPVSPFASTAPASQTTFFNSQGQTQEGGLSALASNIVQGQGQGQQTQVPSGPAAFDTVHLPAKQHSIHGHGVGGMFAHPYAGASARRHATHPLSPLSSGSTSTSTTGSQANSPASATGPSAFGFGFGTNFQSTSTSTAGGGHAHALHHTQSLYALKLARHVAAEREREREELVKRAMNGYAGYEDYSRGFPGTHASNSGNGNGSGGEAATQASPDVGVGVFGDGMRMNGVGPTESAIHPGLLFGNASSTSANGNAGGMGAMNGVKTEPTTTRTTPAPSRSESPSSSGGAGSSTPLSTPGPSTPASSTGPTRKSHQPPQASTTLSRPSSSLLLSKPFKCPTPGCTKSYKQANGLKYHVTHGQCSFTPPPEYSSISELGLSMGVNLKLGPMGLEGLETLSEKERREAEREAERRLRPFCCQVKPCTRRYKNMNGLRYHYQHSGEHGAVGLRMLAEGRHDATRSQSVEKSDEEEYREGQRSAERGLGVTTPGGAGASSSPGGGGAEGASDEGSLERGRRRERKDALGGMQTESAPTTPGGGGATTSTQTRSPFTTQASFAFQHQRTMSGSSGSQSQQQPRSPLSQQFPPPTSIPTSSSSSAQQNQFATTQGMTGFSGLTGVNGIGGMNAMNGIGGQFAFAVQSQPASAYASPWGSRAGSPTSSGGHGGHQF